MAPKEHHPKLKTKPVQVRGVPVLFWACIREAAFAAGHRSIAAYARSLLYHAAEKSNPKLWADATKETRRRSGISDAMYDIYPHLKPPTPTKDPSP